MDQDPLGLGEVELQQRKRIPRALQIAQGQVRLGTRDVSGRCGRLGSLDRQLERAVRERERRLAVAEVRQRPRELGPCREPREGEAARIADLDAPSHRRHGGSQIASEFLGSIPRDQRERHRPPVVDRLGDGQPGVR